MLSNEGSEWFVEFAYGGSRLAIELLLQSTALIALGLLAGWLARSKGAAVQSAIYRLTLVAVLACPVVSLLLRTAGIDGLALSLPAPARPVQELTVGEREHQVEALPVVAPGPTGDLLVAEGPASTGMAHGDAPADFVGPGADRSPASRVATPAGPSSLSTVRMTGTAILACVVTATWLTVSTLLFLRLAASCFGLRRLRRLARQAEPATTSECRALATRMGIRAPAVLRSKLVTSPCLVGFLHPAILLPEVSEGESVAGGEVLAHELAHLARHDCLWYLLSRACRALLFFQPLLWSLARRMVRTAEEVCDDHVMVLGFEAHGYARRLTEIARRSRPPVAAAAVAMVSLRSWLGRRVVRILDTSRIRSTRTGLRALAALALVGVVSTALVGLIEVGTRRATGAPDPGADGAGQREAARAADDQPPSSLEAEVPDFGTVELLGLIGSSQKASGWWAADGSPTEVPQVGDAKLKDLGTIAAFRVAPAELRLAGYCLLGSAMHEFKDTWQGAGEGIVLGAIDHPEGRQFANLMLNVRAPGRRLHTFRLTAEDAGKIRRVDQFGVEAFVALKSIGASQFEVTALHSGDVAKEHLAAVDQSERQHLPTELSQSRGDQYATTLTFAFPLEQLAGIAITKPTAASVQFRNIALRPGLKARPVVAVRQFGKDGPERRDGAPIVADPRFRVELPNEVVVELLGTVRYSDAGMTWWGPEGKARAPVPGVLEADVEGYGTIVAIHFPMGEYSFAHYVERGGQRERVRGAAYIESIRTWLIHLDPAGEMEEATLVLDVTGGKPAIVQTVPITPSDVGREKIVNQGVIERIGKIEAVSPEASKVEVFHRMTARGLELVAVDKAGNVERHSRGSFSREGAELTFPIPLAQLKAIAVQQEGRAEVRFAGISLQPGHRTQVTTEVKDLTEPVKIEPARGGPPKPEAADMPLQVTGRVTDAKTGKPIGQFTVVPGSEHRYGGPSWGWDEAKQCRDGQYAITLQKRKLPARLGQEVHYVRVEAKGYPATISRAFQPTESQVTFDFELGTEEGILGIVQDPSGKPLPDAIVLACRKSRSTQIWNNQLRRGDTNKVFLDVDPDGRFLFSKQEDAYGVMAVHEQGFGLTTLEDLEATGVLTVEPSARVEGTCRIDDRAGADQTVTLEFRPFEDLGRRHGGSVFIFYEATTDQNGRFLFPRVPGLGGKIGRQVVLREHDGGQTTTWAPRMNIEAKPGETVQVRLGGEGRAIVGRLRLPDWFQGKVDWTSGSGHISRTQPEPPYPAGLTREARRRWYDQWRQTPPGRAHWLGERFYGFKLAADGSFRVDDLIAGRYEMRISVYRPPADSGDRVAPFKELGNLEHQFTVPEVTPDTRAEPLDLGQLELKVTRLPEAKPEATDQSASQVQATSPSDGNGSQSNGNAAEQEEPEENLVKVSASGKVVDGEGNPIAGATVYLREWVTFRISQNPYDNQPQDVLAKLRTGTDGAFRFEDVPAEPIGRPWNHEAPWDVVALADGYGMAWRHLREARDETPITLTMPPERKLTGRLLDERDRPIAGARLQLGELAGLGSEVRELPARSADRLDLGLSQVVPTVPSDADGRFTIGGLPPEQRVLVVVEHEQYVRTWCYAATTDRPQPELIDVTYRGHERQEKRHAVHTGEFTLRLEPGYRVLGQVLLADTEALCAHAKVRLHSEGSHHYKIADAQGRFAFHGLRRQEWHVRASAPERGTYLGRRIRLPAMSEDNRTVTVEIRLRRGEEIAGSVVDGATGEGVPGVKVTFKQNLPEDAPDVVYASGATTDEEGSFRIAAPPGKGTVIVYGSVEGYDLPQHLRPNEEPDPRYARSLEVKRGQPVRGIEFELSRGLVIKGRVTDPLGRPVAGAEVKTVRPRFDVRFKEAAAQTDAQGRFTLSGFVAASAQRLQIRHAQRRLLGTVDVGAGQKAQSSRLVNVEVELEQAAGVKGQVLVDGEPRAGVGVQLLEMQTQDGVVHGKQVDQATTDDAGRFQFDTAPPGKDCHVYSFGDDFTQLSSPTFTLKPGQTHDLGTFEVRTKSMSVAGIVVDPDGNPVEGAQVSVRRRSGRSISGAFTRSPTGKDGRFAISAVPNVPLSLMAYIANPPGSRDRSIHFTSTVDAMPGETDVRIVLDPKLQLGRPERIEPVRRD
jgi:beta-lactamase regulating signal transducer with metallopeptidase domain/protocatechuate 3,4-dioxygenase beta subunit